MLPVDLHPLKCATEKTWADAGLSLLLEDVTICGEVLWSSYTGPYPNKNAASFAVGIWALRAPKGAISDTKEMHSLKGTSTK